MPSVRMKWTNENTITKEMNLFIKDFGDMRQSASAVFAWFHKSARDLFSSGGSSGKHGTWPALSPEYAKWKAKNYPGQPLMVRKGSLRDALTSKTSDSILFLSRGSNSWRFHMGVDLEPDYPTFHQKGVHGKTRRSIDLTDQQMDAMAEMIQRRIINDARQYRSLFSIAKASQKARVNRG